MEKERSANSNDESVFDSFNPPKAWKVHSASNLEMIWVEPVTFLMGSPDSEQGRMVDEEQHKVTLTKGFTG